jgi:rubredoxin
MQNRHAQKTVKPPARCPKCGSMTMLGNSWVHARLIPSWKCPMCGLSGESGGFVDFHRHTTVRMEYAR